MTQSDIIYRYFSELNRELQKDRRFSALSEAFVNAVEADKVTVSGTFCRVEEDWIEAIERGLPFIGKAIEEERQFIRSNGEVQPIEKVKQISKESVQHLARHSDYITKQQASDEDIIPDKLYTVERLNDYSVYENRFLYTLLCILKDFVAQKLNEITKASSGYRGELSIRKTVLSGKRKLEVDVKLKDERKDEALMQINGVTAEISERIDKIRRSVNFYLHTPLMEEVSHAEKIKSNVTLTNVLRMDKNFKEVVALYDFLLSYNKAGFIAERRENLLEPLPENVAGELSVPALIYAFLVYEHGLGLEELFRKEYEEENERLKQKQQRELLDKIESVKEKMQEYGAERYIALVEERNSALEQDREQLVAAEEKIENFKKVCARLNEKKDELIKKLNDVKRKREKDFEEYNSDFQKARKELEDEKMLRVEEIENLKKSYSEELSKLAEEKREELKVSASEFEKIIKERDEQLQSIGELNSDLKKELLAVQNENTVLTARLNALYKEYGLLTGAEDFTSEEGFNALEHQYETLGKLLKENWKTVKKTLRKEFYNNLKSAVKSRKKPNAEVAIPENDGDGSREEQNPDTHDLLTENDDRNKVDEEE